MHYIIDRSKWRNGGKGVHKKGEGRVRLLNKDGYMCCLGMICEQIINKEENLKDINLLNASSPEDIEFNNVEIDSKSELNVFLNKTHGLFSYLNANSDSHLAELAMKINDDRDTTAEEKEVRLGELFLKHGITLEFINNYKH